MFERHKKGVKTMFLLLFYVKIYNGWILQEK